MPRLAVDLCMFHALHGKGRRTLAQYHPTRMLLWKNHIPGKGPNPGQQPMTCKRRCLQRIPLLVRRLLL